MNTYLMRLLSVRRQAAAMTLLHFDVSQPSGKHVGAQGRHQECGQCVHTVLPCVRSVCGTLTQLLFSARVCTVSEEMQQEAIDCATQVRARWCTQGRDGGVALPPALPRPARVSRVAKGRVVCRGVVPTGTRRRSWTASCMVFVWSVPLARNAAVRQSGSRSQLGPLTSNCLCPSGAGSSHQCTRGGRHESLS